MANGMGAALVVGATGDVGKAIALALATTGRPLALVGRDRARLDELAVACGEAAVVVVADLRDPAAPLAAVGAAEATMGAIDILVNAAGVFGPLAPLAESDPEMWEETLLVNAVAPYRFARALVPGMVHRRYGRVVNVSSLAALSVPTALNSAYATSKVALNAWTSVLALELAGTGVTANAIHPGDLKSRMWEDIRDAAQDAGSAAFARWARDVGDGGGDDPAIAGRFVARLVDDPAEPTGQLFLLGVAAQRLAPFGRFSLTPVSVPG